jgi:HEAT repeat protein
LEDQNVAKKAKKVRRDPFKLNEPLRRIPSGIRRPSAVLKDVAFTRIRDRARLERLLLQHDPNGSSPVLTAGDMTLVRQMAAEGTVTNHVPAIRRGAIQVLGESPTLENLALLTELALSGEDVYARSHALIALGRTGLALAAPLLCDALKSDDDQERKAAELGLRLLGGRVGPVILAALRQNNRDIAVRNALDQVIATLTGAKRPTQRRHTSTRESVRGIRS